MNRRLHFDLVRSLRSEEPGKVFLISNVLTAVGRVTGVLAILASGFVIIESLNK